MRWLNGITDSIVKFMQTPGDSERQGNLACYIHGIAKSHDLATEQDSSYSDVIWGGQGQGWGLIFPTIFKL